MSDPKWVTREQVERMHAKVIEAAGGAHGLRDANLLESALARPLNQHAYGEDDLHQLAASYAEGIARNHAFVDGNKRTAFATADLFLRKNGYAIQSRDDDGHVTMMENLGQGKLSREDVGNYLRENSRVFEREQSQSQGDIARSWQEKSAQRQTEKPKPRPDQSRKRTRDD